MSRTGEDVTDLLSGLDASAAALNNPRVVRDARAEQEAAHVDTDWRKTMRPRIAFAGVLMLLWAGGIVARLGYLQVLQHDTLLARADRQQSQTIDLNPRRGQILDRYGRVLAYSVDGDVIYAVPSDVKEDAEDVASRLCAALDGCDAEERRSLVQRLDSRRDTAPVFGTLSDEEVTRIEALRERGLVVKRGTGGRTGTLSVVTREVADPQAVATRVCEQLSRCSDDARSTLEKRLSGKKDFVYIRRRATPAEAHRVAALKLRGIGFLKESRRYYPNRDLASSLIGFVDAQNSGVGGLELVYDKRVTGTGGTLIVQQDASRQALSAPGRPPASTPLQHPSDGPRYAGRPPPGPVWS